MWISMNRSSERSTGSTKNRLSQADRDLVLFESVTFTKVRTVKNLPQFPVSRRTSSIRLYRCWQPVKLLSNATMGWSKTAADFPRRAAPPIAAKYL